MTPKKLPIKRYTMALVDGQIVPHEDFDDDAKPASWCKSSDVASLEAELAQARANSLRWKGTEQ